MFTDCAVRSQPRGTRRTIPLAGQTISYGMGPVFYRGSDFAWREMMAVMAFERAEFTNKDACVETAQIILNSPCRHLLGTSKRGRKRRSDRQHDLLDLAAVVKGNVNRLKRRLTKDGSNVNQMFESAFGAFRAFHVRDELLCAKAEADVLKLVNRIERPCWDGGGTELGSYHYEVGQRSLQLARLYHEETKYADAKQWYWRAWGIFIADPLMAAEFRVTCLRSFAFALANCASGFRGARKIAHQGPRMFRGLLPTPRP
jgi:hypothetical protein